jgi:hypothetical protein
VFDHSTSDDSIMDDLRGCQQHLHKHGKSLGVLFDSNKENLLIFGGAVSACFKFVGDIYDSNMSMKLHINQIVKSAAQRIFIAQSTTLNLSSGCDHSLQGIV